MVRTYGKNQSLLIHAVVGLFTIIVCGSVTAFAEKPILAIVAGAESHGMIDACDCEFEPGGGVVKRSSLLKTFGNRKKLLLLDAGGFAAGGIYDDYTAGRSADSMRTIAMIRAMGTMKYDAVAIGDDDLQFGGAWLIKQAEKAGMPLVSANCFGNDGSHLVQPYLLCKKNGMTIGITALTTQEQLFDIDPEVTITDPFEALKNIREELSAKSDMQILLSHCGQEITEQLAEAFDGFELVVNGHRKKDKEAYTLIKNTPILQFGFQGKSLSAAKVFGKRKHFTVKDFRWYDVTPEIADDPQMVHFLKKNQAAPNTSRENLYDLYIMSQCPYGMEALATFMHLSGIDTSFKWNIWFIGTTEDDGTLWSLHGEQEVEDEMLWLAFFENYPDKKRDFLFQRIGSSIPSIDIMTSLGADKNVLIKWKEKNGAETLGKHYARSTRLSIDASPTLLINNRPYQKSLSMVNLQWFHCTTTSDDIKKCGNLPQCGKDGDCRKKGMIGRCDSSGQCVFQDAVPFTFTVLTADETFQHPEEQVIATTVDLFPGVSIKKLTMQSEDGKRLYQTHKPEVLPLYLFDKNVEDAANFSSVESGVTRVGDFYLFQNGVVPANYFPGRKKINGKILLFVDPFFRGLSEIISEVSSEKMAHKITILPILFNDPKETNRCTEEWFRMEEAQRWLALNAVSKKVQMNYLTAYLKNRGTSYWQSHLENSGLSPDSLLNFINDHKTLLDDHWKTVGNLNIKDPVVLLVNNIETITVTGQRMLRRVIDLYLEK